MNFKNRISRRKFLRVARQGTLGAALAFPFLRTERSWGAGESANEMVGVGFIGVGGQGNSNLGALMKHAVAVCDVDQGHLARTKERVEKANGRPCASYGDYRKLLEDKNVDAVLIATPDHWHALPVIHACEAGKDVYCEKPLTLTIQEGQVMVKSARRYKRIVQTGSQQRSDPKFRLACELVRSGRLGKIKNVEVGIAKVNFSGPPVADSAPPPELDYDFWLGSGPLAAVQRIKGAL